MKTVIKPDWRTITDRAFDGFTGPLDAVQPGDFQKLIRALAYATPSLNRDVEQLGKALSGPSITPRMREEFEEANAELARAKAFLARLQPTAKPDEDGYE